MPTFTGKAMDLNIQDAFEDAITQAMRAKAEVVHGQLASVEIKRIYSERRGEGSFNTVFVEIDAK